MTTVNDDQIGAGVVPVSTPLAFTANDCLDIGSARIQDRGM
jgi:arylsulfatase